MQSRYDLIVREELKKEAEMLKKELRALKKSEKEKVETPAAVEGNLIEVPRS